MPSVSKQVKILVSGDVEGNFETLFKRVTAANKKAGPFEMLLCVGEFFGPDEEHNRKLTGGHIQVPIPTYVLGACSAATVPYYASSSSEELTVNLTFLGKKGILTTASGLSVAYLSGTQADSGSDVNFDEETCDQLLVPASAGLDFRGVDVLLTSQWPKSADKYSNNHLPADKEAPVGSALISRVATILKPRYHFSAMAGIHYERSPYRNHRVLQEAARQTTRFIALAKVGNKEKAKFLYAFNASPMKEISREELTEQPPDATEFPYAEVLLQVAQERERRELAKSGDNQFFFDMNAPPPSDDRGKRGQRKRMWMDDGSEGGQGRDGPPQPAAPCWFCLSSPQVEKHLVVSVADSCYLAMAKGGLNADHVLILPIGHIQSIVAAPPDVRSEIDRYKTALKLCFAQQQKSVVFFERNYRTQHMQIQAVAVPDSRVNSVSKAFTGLADAKDLELSVLEEGNYVWELVNEGCPYFWAELPAGERLFTRNMHHFPIQFGREALCVPDVLDAPERVDWRACSLSKDKEEKSAQKFRKKFEKFDIADDED